MEDRAVKERIRMVNEGCSISIRKQCKLMGIDRSSLYYKPLGENALNLKLMETMDKIYQYHPTFGVLRMQDELGERGYFVNEKRVRRLLRKMGIEAIYPKRNLSKLGKAKYIQPYLLRHLEIKRSNQVWAIDITYIPMKKGFMYLTAVIDLHSRFLLGWQISNSLEKETQTELIASLISRYGKPEIINSDQGSQYTSAHWIAFLKSHSIKISMDGKGRATDNAFIERFFRSLKWDHVYLNPAKDGLELYAGIESYICEYNRRKHQGIGRQKPIELYQQAA